MSHSVLICVFSVYFDIQTSFGTHKDPYEEWSYCDFFSEDGIVLESQMVLPVIYELISSLVPLAGNSHLCNIFFLCISGFGTGTTHSNMDESIVGMSVCVLSCFSHIQLYVTLWTIACQAPLSMGFSRQECWSGLLCSSPYYRHNAEQMKQGIKEYILYDFIYVKNKL